jgi:hypothetical protein
MPFPSQKPRRKRHSNRSTTIRQPAGSLQTSAGQQYAGRYFVFPSILDARPSIRLYRTLESPAAQLHVPPAAVDA